MTDFGQPLAEETGNSFFPVATAHEAMVHRYTRAEAGTAGVLAVGAQRYFLHRMSIETRRTSAPEPLRRLTGSTALIGVRLHSSVLAACIGVPSILLAYRNKCEDFLSSMNPDDFAVQLTAAPESVQRLIELWGWKAASCSIREHSTRPASLPG